jgi:hypothetical protein
VRPLAQLLRGVVIGDAALCHRHQQQRLRADFRDLAGKTQLLIRVLGQVHRRQHRPARQVDAIIEADDVHVDRRDEQDWRGGVLQQALARRSEQQLRHAAVRARPNHDQRRAIGNGFASDGLRYAAGPQHHLAVVEVNLVRTELEAGIHHLFAQGCRPVGADVQHLEGHLEKARKGGGVEQHPGAQRAQVDGGNYRSTHGYC